MYQGSFKVSLNISSFVYLNVNILFHYFFFKDLNNVGLETFSYLSVERDSIIVKIRASVKRLSEHATVIGYSMLLDDERLKIAAEEGRKDRAGNYSVKPLKISHNPDITAIEPYKFIYSQFSAVEDEGQLPLFSHADNLNHPFGSVHRLKLLISIIETDAGHNLSNLMHSGNIGGYFPLMDERVANDISEYTTPLKVMPWMVPVDKIKNYLGTSSNPREKCFL